MPKEVLKLAETVYHALWIEGFLLLHALVHLNAHTFEELVDLAIYLLIGLHGLGGALRVGALFEDCFKLLHAFGVDRG